MKALTAVVAAAVIAVGSITVSAQSINMSGSVSFSHQKSAVGIAVQKITNYRPIGSVSGSLVLQLWATPAPYYGGALYGYKMAEIGIGRLNGGYYFSNVSVGGTFYYPPRGTYYTILTLGEWNGSSYSTVDWMTFTPLKYAKWIRSNGGSGYAN
jgi:hypothetical protein